MIINSPVRVHRMDICLPNQYPLKHNGKIHIKTNAYAELMCGVVLNHEEIMLGILSSIQEFVTCSKCISNARKQTKLAFSR